MNQSDHEDILRILLSTEILLHFHQVTWVTEPKDSMRSREQKGSSSKKVVACR